MSKYHTIITQLQWMKLSTIEAKGRTVVSPDIQEWIQSIQKDIRNDIRTNLPTAPLSLDIINSLYEHIPQQADTSILWKEVHNDIDALIEQAQLLETLLSDQTRMVAKKTKPTTLRPTWPLV